MKRFDYKLCLLFTPRLCRNDPWWTLREAIAGGVDSVQWRVKERPRESLATCLELCRELAVPLIVNDDVGLAVEVGADGAHVGQNDLAPESARALLGPDRWLGVSTHSEPEIHAALATSADYLGFGPMFPTATKGYGTGQQAGALRRALELADRPIVAIGGIDPTTIARVTAEGGQCAAVCSAILQSDDPRAAAAALTACVRGDPQRAVRPPGHRA